ncbi:TPA: hypothetical protein UL921_002387 [Stenotrophomonas maltophilia]|nr:hypothetical protein [Stenotrophomonas maltophilia]
MSTSVDVLAVLDREVTRAGGESYPDGRDLIAARTAIADLIEEVEKISKSSPDEYGCYFTNRSNIRIAKKALALVKGA